MIRLARSASLLAAFSLLTSAATAHAECAWVLWEQAAQKTWWGWGPERIEWTTLGAVATLEECEKEQTRHRAMSDVLAKAEAKRAPYMAWRCLPDTVDPRGPKGK